MRAAVVTFPGSNCDRDLAVALQQSGFEVEMLWHKEQTLPEGVDLVGVPGGFSFGDYLRCGAIAAHSPITRAISAHIDRGGFAIGICNGFQILCEMGALPGSLFRNSGIKFICRQVELEVTEAESPFLSRYRPGEKIQIPVAHHDGNYQASEEVLTELKAESRIAFRYGAAINGAADNIAGILSQNGRVLGMMPHPERAISDELGSCDGKRLFSGLMGALVEA